MIAILTLSLLSLAAAPVAAKDGGCGSLESLQWLAGSWGGNLDGVDMEEQWTAIKGGTMLGLHRDIRGGRTVSFEFLRIETTAEGLVYQAQPGGNPAVPFACVELGENRVVFENKAHDFPQRILYWKSADGRLHARIEGLRGDTIAGQEWTWEARRP